ncbi:MAG: hypothetical protein NZ959_12035 [Armatimonadetes bacterium]|nr:hypothetical protein [Armatimonadota bacterium]MDW8121244.1 hypothetical protein [Armatimonadota bacterium]
MKRIGSVFLISFFLIGAQGQDPSVPVRWKFEKGQVLRYRHQVDGRLSFVSEVGVATDLIIKGQLHREQITQSVAEDGSAELLVTLKGTVELMAAGAGAFGLGLDKTVSRYEIKERQFTVRMAADGQVLELKELREKPVKEGGVPELLQDPFQVLAASPALLALLPDRLPDRPCRPGESWTVEEERTAPGPAGQIVKAKVKGEGRFVSIDQTPHGPAARLESKMELLNLGDILSGAPPLKALGVEFHAEGTSQTRWLTVHLIQKGLTVSSETRVETKGTGRVKLPEGIGGGEFQFQWTTDIKGVAELVTSEEPSPKNE